MRKCSVAPVMLCLLTMFIVGVPLPGAADTPPVTKVVLYKHGMGYLEREGKITGDATLSLTFRPEQMKDLLTSFFAVDLGGGKISSVRYETRDPLSKQLEDIPIKVPEEAALSKFLMQLKGARLKAKAAGETVEGRILGVEPTTQIAGNKEVKTGYRLVLLTDAETFRPLDLFSVTEFSLSDEALQRDLRRILDISLDSKSTNRKKLTLSTTGQGERGVRIGYLIEMPIWKCSYRVIFDGKKKDVSPLLQGWALAENNTEDDWKDVTISFVAGNPMSYVMDLYSPYYVKRAQVPIPGLQNLAVDWAGVSPPDLEQAPPVPASPVPGEKKASRRAHRKPDAAHAPAQMMDAPRPAAQSAPIALGGREVDTGTSAPLGDLLSGSFGGDALAAKVGDLFSYEPKDKVSIPRGQAAMVPIISKQVGGRRVLYYKASFSPKPANAFVLQNGTDLTLEAGAVTFFEGSTSLGEGILSHTLPPGSQEVVPYAIDASLDITPQKKTRKEPHFRARLVDGILTLTSVEVLTNTWKIVNRGREAVTLWLHQPKTADYRLSKPEKPLKEVDGHYRFELPLNPAETKEFTVEEKRDLPEVVHLANSSEEQVRFFLAQPYLSAGARAFMKEVSALMAEKAGLQRQINEWTQQVQRLTEEQARLRSNLQTLGTHQPKEQELRAKWVASLAANEDRLTERRTKLDEAGARLRQADESLAQKVRGYRDE